jgi:hypothetical protein
LIVPVSEIKSSNVGIDFDIFEDAVLTENMLIAQDMLEGYLGYKLYTDSHIETDQ